MLKVCCNAIENYSPFLNLLPLTRCSFHHLLFLEASVLNSYSLLKHKAKLLLEAMFFKWQRSTWQPSSIHFRHETSLLRFHAHFGPVYLIQVSKNDDEERSF